MSMSDPLADLLTRVRNGLRAGFSSVEMPASRLKESVCRVLQEEGYIRGYSRTEDDKQGILKVDLKYTSDRTPVITGVQRVSKPSLRVYSGAKTFRPVRSGLGISIVSTSQGVMTSRKARMENVGGEVICDVW